MPKLVRAVGEFYDTKPKVMRTEGEEWVVANDRARGLERAQLVSIVENLDDQP